MNGNFPVIGADFYPVRKLEPVLSGRCFHAFKSARLIMVGQRDQLDAVIFSSNNQFFGFFHTIRKCRMHMQICAFNLLHQRPSISETLSSLSVLNISGVYPERAKY